jgi:hypothetical protein
MKEKKKKNQTKNQPSILCLKILIVRTSSSIPSQLIKDLEVLAQSAHDMSQLRKHTDKIPSP